VGAVGEGLYPDTLTRLRAAPGATLSRSAGEGLSANIMTGLGVWGRRVLIGLPFLWLAVFFLLPLAIVAAISFAESADAIPPFEPLLSLTPAGLQSHITLADYRELAESCLRVYTSSLGNAALATLLCLLLGYPVAFAISRTPGVWRHLLLFLVMLPFWTSFLIRVYAWIALLQPSGLINRLLLATGLVETPLPLLYNGFSVELGLVYSYLPFMILPLYGSLARLDESLVEAAADLGAPPWRVFLGITLPLTMPGIAAGCLLVFIPAVGEFVIPDLLGGPGTLMIGKLLWQEFFDNVDWPAASAIAVALVVLLTAPLLVAQRLAERAEEAA
jgi:putrescine transport system permease protein